MSTHYFSWIDKIGGIPHISFSASPGLLSCHHACSYSSPLPPTTCQQLPTPSSPLSRIIIIIILVCEAIGTAATPGLLCQPRVIMKMIVVKQMECRLAGETEVLEENLPQRNSCPSQNPTWPDPGLNPGRRGGKPATNRLSYCAASPDPYFTYLVVDKRNNWIQLSNNKSTTLDKWHTTWNQNSPYICTHIPFHRLKTHNCITHNN
jgi:hypothetical protein